MSNEQKLTPWFDGSVRPERVGLYQRENRVFKHVDYSYWNGVFWGGWAEQKQSALNNCGTRSSAQDFRWRGLAQEPSHDD
jgi:hypothetical protein